MKNAKRPTGRDFENEYSDAFRITKGLFTENREGNYLKIEHIVLQVPPRNGILPS
jgi:hypothetical protein